VVVVWFVTCSKCNSAVSRCPWCCRRASF